MTVAPNPNLPDIASYIRDSKPYEPGKPIEELRRELGLADIIKMASNESPIGMSPKALNVFANPEEICRLYPDASHSLLVALLPGTDQTPGL